MTTLYKLTDQNGYTRAGHDNACLWGPGVSHSGTGKGELCGPGWIHAYTHPLLAVVLNPIHANLGDPRLWEAEGEVALNDDGLKVGCRTLTTVRELPLPAVTTEQRISFAILCAREVTKYERWNLWAERWLSGENRSRKAAQAAEAVASKAVLAAAAAEAVASKAAWAAARASGAAWAAWAAASAAWAVTWAARAAKAATWETAAAARAAPLDLVALAERAVNEEV